MAHGISVRRFRSTHSLTAVLGQLRVVVVSLLVKAQELSGSGVCHLQQGATVYVIFPR